MFNSGFEPSVIDGSEVIYKEPENKGLPKQFSYMKYLPKVLDQGSQPICVPCSISAFVNYDLNLKDGSKEDNKVDVYGIYKKKTFKGEGMTFKEAFKILRNDGVKTDKGNVKISKYAMIRVDIALKHALVMNGPCIGALPVFNSTRTEFWNKSYGDLEGYHAVAIVGYTEDGFIIRNSWGTQYGEDGYSFIKNKDFNNFLEIWTILG